MPVSVIIKSIYLIRVISILILVIRAFEILVINLMI